MNKRIFASIGIGCIAAILVFLNHQKKSKEDRFLDAISSFIYNEAGDFERYDALELIPITNELLLEDVQLKNQLAVVKDTLAEKVSLLKSHAKFPKSWADEVKSFQQLVPDQIDDWIRLKAKIDLALTAIEDNRLALLIHKETVALNLIEAKLNALNLSVYCVDLSGQDHIHYLHRFALDGEEVLSVFELDADKKEVISYKAIG